MNKKYVFQTFDFFGKIEKLLNTEKMVSVDGSVVLGGMVEN